MRRQSDNRDVAMLIWRKLSCWCIMASALSMVTRIGDKKSIFARTCCTRGVCVGTLLLLLLPGRGNGPACAHATIDVLLFLLRRLQDL